MRITAGLFMLCYLGMVASILLYNSRYDLGLEKPRYVGGQCISRDTSTEFEKSSSNMVVFKVGTKHYKLGYILSDGQVDSIWGSQETFEYIDTHYEPIDCALVVKGFNR